MSYPLGILLFQLLYIHFSLGNGSNGSADTIFIWETLTLYLVAVGPPQVTALPFITSSQSVSYAVKANREISAIGK